MKCLSMIRQHRKCIGLLIIISLGNYIWNSVYTSICQEFTIEPKMDTFKMSPTLPRKKIQSMFEMIEVEPFNTTVQKIVFYLWCGINPHFGFHNYLSLQSVAKFLQPERIVFLYSEYPKPEKNMYDTWLEEFKDSYPYLEMIELKESFAKNGCQTKEGGIALMFDYLYEGGIFIGTSTVLTKPSQFLWNIHFLNMMNESRDGILVCEARNGAENIRKRESIKLQNATRCPRIQLKNSAEFNKSFCINLPMDIKPKDIWSMDSKLGNILNFLMYGQETTPHPMPHSMPVIPNVGHMLWLNGRQIEYMFYLSALSFLYVAKVEKLYIHGDIVPAYDGYWQRLFEEGHNIHFIKHIKPTRIYNQKCVHAHHMSDIFRAEIMNRYGGIYSDVDVIWTQPISEELRKYEAVAAYDWAHNYPGYPDYINLGVSMGRRGAPFWQYFMESMKVFKDDIFGFNGLLQPYKVYERHPDTLLIEPHLQVMCYYSSCYPRWTDMNWKFIDWKKDTYAFHWTYPNPPEFMNKETLLGNKTIWAQIGTQVLEQAGRL